MEKLTLVDGITSVFGRFKNAGVVTHFHETYSIGIVTWGAHHYKKGSVEKTVVAGETRIVAPYELHETLPGEWEYLHFDIAPQLFLNFIQDLEQNYKLQSLSFSPTFQHETLLTTGLQLHQAIQHDEQLEVEQAFSDFSTLLLHCSDSLNLISNISLDNVKLGRAIEYIFTFWDDPNLSVEEIAREVRFSTYYFARSFRKAFAITPHKYIQSLRVERAKHRIISSNDPLAQIAVECGFSDQSHMNRVFKRIMGITPNVLRNSV